MPNYCTVCGVKLTAKNKISYRPSSCRDCELERKRLYSLKRKIKNELEEKSPKVSTKAAKATANTVKAVKSSKATAETKPNPKVEPKSKSKTPAKTVELATPKVTSKKDAKAIVVKESSSPKKDKKEEKLSNIDDVEIKAVSTKAEPEKKTSAKEKELNKAKTSNKPTNTKADLSSKKKKAKDAEDEIEDIEIIEEDLEEDLAIDAPAVAKVVKPVSAPIIIPSYIKEAAKIQVKKRRLGTINSAGKSKLNNHSTDSQSEDVSSVFALGKNLTEEDLLRAPSDTPWESSSFKIVDGSFVEHGAEDQDEAKGPSPEEIKNIIERIRLEHKTRRG